MNRWTKTGAALALTTVAFLAGHVSAQEEPGGAPMMPEWGQKGPQHEQLAKTVGDWDVAVKMAMAPGQPPMEMQGRATGESVYDGRFVKLTYHGDFMGAPFEGTNILAYDRVDEEWVAIWYDSMSTYISISRGKEKDGVITYEMNDPDWMTGQKKKTTMVRSSAARAAMIRNRFVTVSTLPSMPSAYYSDAPASRGQTQTYPLDMFHVRGQRHCLGVFDALSPLRLQPLGSLGLRQHPG